MSDPSKKTPKQKGDELEDAVEAIHRVIMQHTPLKHAKLHIERKKLIFPGGVKKEIDLYIRANCGMEMDVIYIFECKNWEDSVPANEITIFAQKIDDVQASKGFFIAKKFAKDATLEAKKHPRITLLNASDVDIDPALFPSIHFIRENPEKRVASATLLEKADRDMPAGPLDLSFAVVHVDGKEVPAKEWIGGKINDAINEDLNKTNTTEFEQGTHKLRATRSLDFGAQNIRVVTPTKDFILARLDFEVDFELDVAKPVLVSQFDIERKGIFIRQKMETDAKDLTMNVDFVQLKRQ